MTGTRRWPSCKTDHKGAIYPILPRYRQCGETVFTGPPSLAGAPFRRGKVYLLTSIDP